MNKVACTQMTLEVLVTFDDIISERDDAENLAIERAEKELEKLELDGKFDFECVDVKNGKNIAVYFTAW